MSYLAIGGFALFGISALAAFIFAVRMGGLREDVATSEADRDRLEQDLRDATRSARSRVARLGKQVRNLQGDIEVARAELTEVYGRCPGLAPERLDSAIDRARRILESIRSGRPPGVPDSSGGPS